MTCLFAIIHLGATGWTVINELLVFLKGRDSTSQFYPLLTNLCNLDVLPTNTPVDFLPGLTDEFPLEALNWNKTSLSFPQRIPPTSSYLEHSLALNAPKLCWETATRARNFKRAFSKRQTTKPPRFFLISQAAARQCWFTATWFPHQSSQPSLVINELRHNVN